MRSEKNSHDNIKPTNWVVVSLVVFGVVVGLLPILFQMSAPSSPRLGAIFAYLPALVVAVLCYALDTTASKKEKTDVVFLCVILTFLTTYLHVWLVDLGYYEFFQGVPNIQWQLYVQQAVLNLSPETLPHSYRFLPNSIVRLFEQLSGEYVSARDAYRNLFGILFFYSFYRLARLFLRHGGSLFCLPFLATILPISFRYYAGQLTDPISHLSFILAFIFIETEQFIYLLLALTIGCLAKETILAIAGYYLLFRWREKSFWLKSAILVTSAIAIYELARIWVLHGLPSYKQISGVPFEHVAENWVDYSHWVGGVVYTVLIFVPFVIAGWRTSPWTLRSLAMYWFPMLFVSGLFFSWLRESRNFVPLSAILVIMTVHYLLPGERLEVTSSGNMIKPGVKPHGFTRPGPRKVKLR